MGWRSGCLLPARGPARDNSRPTNCAAICPARSSLRLGTCAIAPCRTTTCARPSGSGGTPRKIIREISILSRPCSLGADVWLAWQFDRPDAGRGVVQAFRRAESIYETARMRLRGLDPAARYLLTDLDHPGDPRKITGRELMESGLEVAISARPGSAVLTYAKLPGR